MAQRFNRVARLQMGTVIVTGLRVAFKVELTPQSEPNGAEISVWNLSEATRSKLVEASVPLILEAGHVDLEGQLFSGDIQPKGITSKREGTDWITTFTAADGAFAYRQARIQRSFAKGAKVGSVLETLAKSMGLGLGKSLDKLRAGDVEGALTEFLGGTTLSGSASQEMDRLTRSLGLEWSIQNGELQVLELGTTNGAQVVKLTPTTGLVGSPEVGDKGVVKAKALLEPSLRPGRGLRLESQLLNGDFVCRKVLHQGDTHGPTWYTEVEANRL